MNRENAADSSGVSGQVDKLWAGRRTVITGSAHGIGEAVARRAARLGASVAVVDLDEAAAQDLAEGLNAAGGAVMAVVTDVTDSASISKMVQEVVRRFGGIDVLINAAGGFTHRVALEDITDQDWRRVVDLNLYSTFACCRAVLPGMKKARYGRIVNISSDAGRMPLTLTAAHYAAAKSAVLGLTRHLAREVGEFGITVNAVAPGTTLTERVRGLYTDEAAAKLKALTPIGRLGEVDDQVHPILFLASDEARYITGATLDVNGGRLML